ncbi:uncharacterized protein [Typha latifolia]|uniref:uncharacterized protein n=1 Tax=Typha latifolia TaxID=4733 RepID=UPI003C305F64
MENLGPGETLDGGPSEKPPEPKTLETLGGAAEVPQGDDFGLGLGLGIVQQGNAVAPVESSPFAAGDLVWGKIKSQPWWPGQVIDPTQASDQAVLARRKGGASVLVSFFGSDGSFAWCQPSQLKPFFSEDLGEMARQSRSKGLITAIEEALGFISRCLELGLTCHCIPPEARSMGPISRSEKLGFVNFSPMEFLDCVRNVAIDVFFADMIECASLQGWVVALGKGWCGGSVGYHKRRNISELVDKIDLDVPAGDLIDGKEEDEEEKLSKSRKKRSMASLIAEMDLDTVEVSDAEEVKVDGNVEPEDQKINKKKKSKSMNVEIGSFKNEEELGSGSGRRERKKSKYLSPPYTDTKDLVPPKIAEAKKSKNCTDPSQVLLSDSASILKCNSEMVQNEENTKGPPFKSDGMSVREIFSELICTAQSSSHLKWNRSAKVVRGFFAMYRSSMYVEATGYGSYQKHVKDSCCGIGQSPVKEVADNPDVRKSEGNGDKDEGGAGGETHTCLGSASINSSKQKKARQKRKMAEGGSGGETLAGRCLSPASINTPEQRKAKQKRKKVEGGSGGETLAGTFLTPASINTSEQKKQKQKRKKADVGSGEEAQKGLATDLTNHSIEKEPTEKRNAKEDKSKTEAPMNMDLHSVSFPAESNYASMNKKNNDDANGGTTVNSIKDSIDFLESAKASLESFKSKEVANGNSPMVMDHELKDHPQEGKSKAQQKRRKRNNGPTGATLPCTGHKASSGSGVGNSRQKRKKGGDIYGNPAALLLNFNPGVVLPSKEELVSTFSKYGLLIETEIELLQDSGSARLVFAKSTDAEAAFNSSDKLGVFGPPFTTYQLRYLPPMKVSSPPTPIPIPKPPLPFIRKSLERMISSLTGTSSPLKKAASPDGLKPEIKENLVGEMQGLLKKVDKMLSGPPAVAHP